MKLTLSHAFDRFRDFCDRWGIDPPDVVTLTISSWLECEAHIEPSCFLRITTVANAAVTTERYKERQHLRSAVDGVLLVTTVPVPVEENLCE